MSTVRRQFIIPFATLAAMTLVVAAMVLVFPSAEAQDGSVPGKPKGLSADPDHDRVELSWSDPQDKSISGYVILRRLRYDDPSGRFTTHVENTGTPAATYTDDDVQPQTHYTYRIKAINEHGPSERSRWLHVYTPAMPPPAWPTGLSAVATSHDAVDLTWDDPGDQTITGYAIYRRNPDIHALGVFITLVADTGTAATSYTDTRVDPETSYIYRVQAINPAGESPRSDWARADTPAMPLPQAPTGLAAQASHDAVDLTWDDPGDSTITGYSILRRNPDVHGEDVYITVVEDTGTPATEYTDQSVEPETTYVYLVRGHQRGRAGSGVGTGVGGHARRSRVRPARPAHRPGRRGFARRHHPELGRPRRRHHHGLRDPAARPRRRRRRLLQRQRG